MFLNKSDGYLYVVLFDNGYLKIGRSFRAPQYRIASHETKANIVGAKKVQQFTFPVSCSVSKAEYELLKFCASRFKRISTFGSEWFLCEKLDSFCSVVENIKTLASQCEGLKYTCPTEKQVAGQEKFFAMLGSPINPVQQVFPRSMRDDLSEAYGIAKCCEISISNQLIFSSVLERYEKLNFQSHYVVIVTAYLWKMPTDKRFAFMQEQDEEFNDDYVGLFGVLAKAEDACILMTDEEQEYLRKFFAEMASTGRYSGMDTEVANYWKSLVNP